jgi:hypothetical protein
MCIGGPLDPMWKSRRLDLGSLFGATGKSDWMPPCPVSAWMCAE